MLPRSASGLRPPVLLGIQVVRLFDTDQSYFSADVAAPITFLNHVPQSRTKRLFALISEFAFSNVQELALSMLRSIPPKIISA